MTRTRALCMWKEEHNACPGRTEKQVAGGTATFHRRLAGSQPGTSVTGMMPTLSLSILSLFLPLPSPVFPFPFCAFRSILRFDTIHIIGRWNGRGGGRTRTRFEDRFSRGVSDYHRDSTFQSFTH